MAEHTKGPLRVGKAEPWIVFDEQGDAVADFDTYGVRPPKEERANARLFVQAGTMLDALEWIAAQCEDVYSTRKSAESWRDVVQGIQERAEQAIRDVQGVRS